MTRSSRIAKVAHTNVVATYLGIGTLVGEISRMDEDIALRQFDCAVMRVRKADESSPPKPRLLLSL